MNISALYARDRGLCWICTGPVKRSDATKDHLVPQSHGGYRNPRNEALAHTICNHARGDLPIEVTREVIAAAWDGPGDRQGRLVQALRLALKERRRAIYREHSAKGHRPWCDMRTRFPARDAARPCTCDFEIGQFV